MNWSDIVGIVLVSTMVNHLGLISAIEGVIRCRLPIVSCPKCLSFWLCLAYCLDAGSPVIASLAISLLCAWLALWVELGMALIDNLYLYLYEKIITASNNHAPASDPDGGNSAGTVPEL